MSGMGEPLAGFNFQDNGGQNQPGNDDSLAEGFLASVPEADREIVGKYVKQWDAGVTRRFQDIHARYEPYKEFGDFTQLATMKQVYEYLQTEEGLRNLYDQLHQQYGQQQGSGGQGTGSGTDETEWGDLPPAAIARLQSLDQQQQLLHALGQAVVEMRQGSQQQQEDTELESYMNALHDHFGDFDDEFVLAKMFTGMDGEEAVKVFFERFGDGNSGGMQQQGRQPFRVLSGGGAVGQQGNFDPTKASRPDTRNMVAQMLELAQRQGQ